MIVIITFVNAGEILNKVDGDHTYHNEHNKESDQFKEHLFDRENILEFLQRQEKYLTPALNPFPRNVKNGKRPNSQIQWDPRVHVYEHMDQRCGENGQMH